jgi:hypothetical protein
MVSQPVFRGAIFSVPRKDKKIKNKPAQIQEIKNVFNYLQRKHVGKLL